MPMRQMAGCIDKALNERSYRDQQAREKKHRMHCNAQSDCDCDQQSRRCWFHHCEEDCFHNADSFLHKNISNSV